MDGVTLLSIVTGSSFDSFLLSHIGGLLCRSRCLLQGLAICKVAYRHVTQVGASPNGLRRRTTIVPCARLLSFRYPCIC